MAEADDCKDQKLPLSLEGNPLKERQAEAIESVTPEPTSRSAAQKPDDMNIVSGRSDKEGAVESPVPTSTSDEAASTATNDATSNHSPAALPRFIDPKTCMWTASYEANDPSEDRSSSLVNVLLRPLNEEQHSLIRMSLWSVIDGHGGGCVATYASEVLLPHVAASVSHSLDCEIVDRGECRVNGELRDANAIDFEHVIGLSDCGHPNRNSINYRTPSEDEDDDEALGDGESFSMDGNASKSVPVEDEDCDGSVESGVSLASPLLPRDDISPSVESSVKTSVKTASSARRTGPAGTHSTGEVRAVTRAITESFCAVDEGWINSIDVAATRQTTCQTNGAWNAGACALVVFTIQRLDWTTKVERISGARDAGQDTNHIQDGAKRNLDNASKGNSVRSMSTLR